MVAFRGAPTGGGGARVPPWDLKNTTFIFRISSEKLRELHLLNLFFFKFFCYVGGLRKPAAW